MLFLRNINKDYKEILLDKAKKAVFKAYCPYSDFPVAAALLCEDGTIFTGVNIENASYGLTVCAERVAVFKAVSEGKRDFKAIALYAPKSHDICPPCGACLQVLAEFNPEMEVIMLNKKKEIVTYKVNRLMPVLFKF